MKEGAAGLYFEIFILYRNIVEKSKALGWKSLIDSKDM
jgi:hypothetical protein